MQLTTNWKVFQQLRSHVGLVAAVRLTLFKIARRILAPHAKTHYSQTGEDLVLEYLVRRYLGGARFVDLEVGCHDARKISSTYSAYLDGCKGVCVDLDSRYAESFGSHRPLDIFVCAAVSDGEREMAVYEFDAAEVNTLNAAQAHEWSRLWRQKGTRLVTTCRLSSIAAKYLPGGRVDVLLLDVEGAELAILRGADLGTLSPSIIVCEMHNLLLSECNSNEICSYLGSYGYELVAYATMNGYFLRKARLEYRDKQ